MPALILPFRTRAQYEREMASDDQQLTNDELSRHLTLLVLDTVHALVRRFKNTGKWNKTVDAHVRQALTSLKAAAKALVNPDAPNPQSPQGTPKVQRSSPPAVRVIDFTRS